MFNQMIKNDFSNNTGLSPHGCTTSLADHVYTMTRTEEGNFHFNVQYNGLTFEEGHKYFVSYKAKANQSVTAQLYLGSQSTDHTFGTDWQRFTALMTQGSTNATRFYVSYVSRDICPSNLVVELTEVYIIDVTRAFQSGDVPSLAKCSYMFPLYYPYNPGELINFMGMKSAGSVYDELTPDKAIPRIGSRAYTSGDENDNTLVTDGTTTYYPLETPTETPIIPPLNLSYKVADFGTETVDDGHLITDGFNQWDEEWEIGNLVASTGAEGSATNCIRAVNYIACFPNTNYYFKSPAPLVICYYDIDKTFISGLNGASGNTIRTTPENCYYIRVSVGSVYGTVYNNDICINLSWSGYRNGEYEPYWKRTLDLCVDDYFTDDNPENMPYAPFNAVIKYSMDYAREVPRLRTQVDDLLERVTALENA